MNIILAEDYRYPLGSLIDMLKQEFPPNSVLSVNSENVMTVLKKLETRPVLSEGWLVIVRIRRIESTLIKGLNNENNVVVYVTRSVSEAHELASLFVVEGIKYNFVDNMKPNEDLLREYIEKELDTTSKIAKMIIKRCKSKPRRIYDAVETLRGLDKITIANVNRYVDDKEVYGLDSYVQFVVGSKDRLTYNAAARIIKNYKYATPYLCSFLVKRLSIYLKVYEEMLVGKLSLENYKDYYRDNKKDLSQCFEWTIKNIITDFDTVSYDKIYYLWVVYSDIKERGSNTVELLTALRLSI